MTRTEAADMVRNRWQFLGIGTPEEFPRVFSSDVDNLLEELSSTGNILDVAEKSANGVSTQTCRIADRPREGMERVQVPLCGPENDRRYLGAERIVKSVLSDSQILDVADQGNATSVRIGSLCVGDGGGCPSHSPLYLLASEIVDIVEFGAQYRAEEEAAAEAGALIEASGYQDPAYERNGR